MTDTLELLFRAITSDDGGLDRINNAVKKIGTESGLTGQALANLQGRVTAEFAKMTAAGLNFEQQIKRIGQSGDTLGRGVSGAAKQIVKDLQDASNAAKNLATQQASLQKAKSSLQGAISNPFQALTTSAVNASAALGPVGIAINAVALAATLGGKALFDLVDAQGKAAQETVNMAAQLGISAGQMKKLQLEAGLVGIGFSSMQIAARQLAVAIEEPTGAGKRASQTLRDLGVATQTASGAIRQEGAVFNDAIEKLAGIEDQTKRTEEATRLFGSRSSASILLLINRYDELNQKASELGYGDTTKLTEDLAKTQEHINALSASWDLLRDKAAETIHLKAILDVATKVLTNGVFSSADAARQAGGWGIDVSRSQDPFTIDPRTALKNSDAGGLGYASQQHAADLAAGKGIANKSNAEFAKTLDGLSAKLREVNEAIGKDRDSLSRGGLSGAAAADKTSNLASLEREKTSLEETIARARQAQSELRRLTEDAKYPGLHSESEPARLQAQRDKSIDIVGAANAALPQQEYEEKITAFWDKVLQKVLAENEKTLDREMKKSKSEMDKEFDAYNKQVTATGNADALRALSYQDGLDKLNASGQRSALSLQQKSVLGYSRLQSGGESPEIAQLEGNFQIASVQTDAKQRAAELAQLVAQLEAGADQSEKVQDKIKDLRLEEVSTAQKAEEEIATLRLDTELKLAEMRKQELAQYKQEAGSIFDALRQPGGRGMEQWFKGQSTSLARGVFSNATAPILQNIGQSLGGATAGMPPEVQALFKGTILDSSHAKSPQIDATDQNTKALHSLTAALTGQSVGGDSVNPAPGSLVSNAAALGTGATAPFFPRGTNAYLDAKAASGHGAIGSDGLPLLSAHDASRDLANFTKALQTPATGLAGFTKGMTSDIGNWSAMLSGQEKHVDPNTGAVTYADISGAQQAGAIAGTTAAAGAGIYESVNQFQKGGVSGDLGGVAALAGTAALLDPDPTSKMALTISATLLSMFSSLFGSSIEQREAAIGNQAAFNTYVAPPTLNRSLSASGGFEMTNDKYGQPVQSSYTSVQIEQPFKYQSPIKDPSGYYQNWETAAGQIIEPYAAPAAQPAFMTSQAPQGMTFIQNINAIDTESIMQAGSKLATAIQAQVLAGHPIGQSLQRAIIGG